MLSVAAPLCSGVTTGWVCCPDQCSEWTLFVSNIFYSDVVTAYGRGSVYCLESLGCPFEEWALEEWDISDLRRPRIEWKGSLPELGYDYYQTEEILPREPDLMSRSLHRLVYAEHSDQLFLVMRHFVEGMDPHGASVVDDYWNDSDDVYPYKTVSFDVHLIETSRRKVSYMEHSLDGLVMFVGLNNSFAVTAADFPHLNPDSIYFNDHVEFVRPKWVDKIYGGHDIGIYDYKNMTMSSCYYPSHHQALKKIDPTPFWFTPTPTSP